MGTRWNARVFVGGMAAMAWLIATTLLVADVADAEDRPLKSKPKLAWEGTVPPAGVRPIGPLRRARLAIEKFESAPFPYAGQIPGANAAFLDVEQDGRRGRNAPREARVVWEDEAYARPDVLLYLPKGFRASRPAALVLYLHGNRATLARDVVERQRLPQQIARSGVNVVLIAPQLAYDIRDSSAGKFWEPGALERFLAEAAPRLARLHGLRRTEAIFRSLPVIVIAYSGGYLPAAWLLHHGGADEQVRAAVVMDGVYDEVDKLAAWATADRRRLFVSAFTASSATGNARLAERLRDANLEPVEALDALAPGRPVLLRAPPEIEHEAFLSKAWTEQPVVDLLRRIGPHVLGVHGG